jgi:hypothetical protein
MTKFIKGELIVKKILEAILFDGAQQGSIAWELIIFPGIIDVQTRVLPGCEAMLDLRVRRGYTRTRV